MQMQSTAQDGSGARDERGLAGGIGGRNGRRGVACLACVTCVGVLGRKAGFCPMVSEARGDGEGFTEEGEEEAGGGWATGTKRHQTGNLGRPQEAGGGGGCGQCIPNLATRAVDDLRRRGGGFGSGCGREQPLTGCRASGMKGSFRESPQSPVVTLVRGEPGLRSWFCALPVPKPSSSKRIPACLTLSTWTRWTRPRLSHAQHEGTRWLPLSQFCVSSPRFKVAVRWF